MTGYERLNVLHGVFHPEGEPFNFDFSWLAPSGLSTKDFICLLYTAQRGFLYDRH